MMQWFAGLNAVVQTLFATILTWGLTAAGAATVFLFREIDRKLREAMKGFAAGVMIAVSFWSLLAPAMETTSRSSRISWLPAAIGFLAGGCFLFIVDKVLPHLHAGSPLDQAEGPGTAWKRSVLLVAATALHNIPEGIAVGFAFAAAAGGMPGASVGSAIALTIGIGIQNFPEGVAVSVPLRREGMRPRRAFWYGQMSGAVEPVVAVIGALAVVMIPASAPYALAFAAGAMVFMVVEDIAPEPHEGRNADLRAAVMLVGFTAMMILDAVLG